MTSHARTLAISTLAAALGCAHERDFARVDANLARPYAADEPVVVAPATLAARPVESYGIARDRTPIQPTSATPTIAAAPQTPIVAPTSSTGRQPYYYVPVSGTPQPAPLPAPTVQSQAPVVAPTVAPTVVQAGATMPTGVTAGVYPVQPVGMWQPTGTPAPVPPIALQSTGSSFNPRDPAVGRVDTSTGSSLTQAPGQVLPASATAPFATAIPNNAPPPMNQRPLFLSESGEAQGSRLPPPRTAAEPATPLNSNDNTMIDVPKDPRKRGDAPPPTSFEGDRPDSGKAPPPPKERSLEDFNFGKRETEAPSAQPPRGKSAPPAKRSDPLPMDTPPTKKKESPKSVEPPKPDLADGLPGFDDRKPKTETKKQPEKAPNPPKKSPTDSSKKDEIKLPGSNGVGDNGPGSDLPVLLDSPPPIK